MHVLCLNKAKLVQELFMPSLDCYMENNEATLMTYDLKHLINIKTY